MMIPTGFHWDSFSVSLRAENQFRATMSFFDTGFPQVSLFVEFQTNRTHDGGLRNSFSRIGDVYMGKSYSLAYHAMLGVLIFLYYSLSSPPLTVTRFVPRSRIELLFSNRTCATLCSLPLPLAIPLLVPAHVGIWDSFPSSGMVHNSVERKPFNSLTRAWSNAMVHVDSCPGDPRSRRWSRSRSADRACDFVGLLRIIASRVAILALTLHIIRALVTGIRGRIVAFETLVSFSFRPFSSIG